MQNIKGIVIELYYKNWIVTFWHYIGGLVVQQLVSGTNTVRLGDPVFRSYLGHAVLSLHMVPAALPLCRLRFWLVIKLGVTFVNIQSTWRILF